MGICVYTFKGRNDEHVTFWSTQDYDEAKSYAQENNYKLICDTYTYDDSELLEDYTEEPELECSMCGEMVTLEDRKDHPLDPDQAWIHVGCPEEPGQ
jgi:hypothetical protein